MKRFALAIVLGLLMQSSAFATWSLLALDTRTGQVIIASATCVPQSRFPPRPSRDLMDIQAVIVPGVAVAACQASVDNSGQNQQLVFDELKKGTPPAEIIEKLREFEKAKGALALQRRLLQRFEILTRFVDAGCHQHRVAALAGESRFHAEVKYDVINDPIDP